MIECQMLDFCLLYNLSNLIKELTCYKYPWNPTSIDVIITNRVNFFQNYIAIETGISGHHKMVVTVLKVYVKKLEPITVKYRCHENFYMNDFTELLKQKLEDFGQIMSYDDLKDIFMITSNNHAPERKNIVRGNQAPFTSHCLSKAIMYIYKLKNKFNKNPTEENKNNYKKLNFCWKLLRQENKKFYNNLDLNVFEDNRIFWSKHKTAENHNCGK